MNYTKHDPVINLLEDVHTSLDAEAFYLALMGALALPDICAALQAPDGRTTGARYEAWFDRWLSRKYAGFLSGSDCYSFRCALLHMGRTGQAHRGYSRIVFLAPGTTTNVIHKCVLNDALALDLKSFCTDLTSAVHEWMPTVQGVEPFDTNIKSFIRVHPNGLSPYIVGAPVIG